MHKKQIRALGIRQPYACLIAHGHKSIEIRSRRTTIRERIAIYATQRTNCGNDLAWVKEYAERLGLDVYAPMQYGRIIATVDLTDCRELSYDEFVELQPMHWNPLDNFREGKTFAWELKDPVMILPPVRHKFSQGRIVWENVDAGILEATI